MVMCVGHYLFLHFLFRISILAENYFKNELGIIQHQENQIPLLTSIYIKAILN